MNETATVDFEASIASYELARNRLLATQQAIEAANNELANLRANADITDAATLSRVSQLLAIIEVGPGQLPRLDAELHEEDRALHRASTDFQAAHVFPLWRNIEQRALAHIEPDLKPLFANADALREAACGTNFMRELSAIRQKWQEEFICAEGAKKARVLLVACAALAAFEKKHLS